MMKPIRILILTTLTLLFAACGGTAEPEQSAAEPTVRQAADPGDAPTRPIEVVEESAGDEASANAAAPEDNAVGDRIVLAQADKPAAAAPQKFKAGTDYVKLTTAQGTSSPPDVVEVAEVFWYGCPHCFNFDPIVNNWKKNLPDGVNFIRLPVMWNPTNAIHARLFFTLEALGKLDEVHPAIFTEMHINNNMLTTEAAITTFVGKHGISAADFKKTFRSFTVESKLKRATNLTQRYRIQSVPLLVINGTYLASGEGVKSFADMLAVADELIARELQDR